MARKIIEKCNTYEVENDSCLICETGFQKTDDGTLCLDEIPNCLNYAFYDKNYGKHKC